MHTAPTHLTAAELEQGLADVMASPKNNGLLKAVFVRPEENERQTLSTANLSPEEGIEGDRWARNHWKKLPNGQSDPQSQISLMNVRVLQLVSGQEEAMPLAGDNLIVDLDLSEENLPAGSRLQIGEHVVLEMTAEAHTGCGKFSRRYGQQAREFVNGPRGKPLNLRGRFARVTEGGTIENGDSVAKAQN